ncbi:hypothetical protein [Polaribacter sp. Hel1_85]|uniref:hypothetical protein n=1 Tax=Polaribacter sp. Hel1_85 TaxID=1250005 RepID=UPI00052BD0DE|nr:hypothetical protein [Polaribacter sp. Hel1_85]KGL61828.1 hypothetical protein PHEL85_1613 [Polaribacter sp. Hel1_85]
MKKEIKNFINDWNSNSPKLEPGTFFRGKSPNDLMNFCLEIHKEIIVKELLFEIKKGIDKDLLILKPEIFKKALEYNYHIKNISIPKENRKYLYEGEERNYNDLKFIRTIDFKDNKIIIPKIEQGILNEKIVEYYCNQKEQYGKSAYDFIFYQSWLNNFDDNLIKIWCNLISNSQDSTDDFINKLPSFFNKFLNLKQDSEKIEFWVKEYLKDKNFRFFDTFCNIQIENNNEVFISFFKKFYYLKLTNEFISISKKSVNKQTYLKRQIKKYKSIIETKPTYNFSNLGDLKDTIYNTYNKLVSGDRKYFNTFIKTDRAGEVEAILEFIKYLESLSKNNTKKIIIKEKVENNIELLPIEIFDNTKHYLKKNAIQVNTCYKYKAFDACLILLRKITETLIIELFEKEQIEDKIRDNEDNYFMLKKLIVIFQNEQPLKKYRSRVTNRTLPKLKEYGDLSAHMRRFNATEADIDRMRDDFRAFFQELTYSIYH